MTDHPANTPASGGGDNAAIAAARDEYERWSTAYSTGEAQGRRAWVCRHDDDGQWRPTTYHANEGRASDACHEEALAASVRAALAAQPPKADGGVVPAGVEIGNVKGEFFGGLHAQYPDPTEADLADPQFLAAWEVIKHWDVNVHGAYTGYCGAMGNHVMAVLNAIRSAAPPLNTGPEVGGGGEDLIGQKARELCAEVCSWAEGAPCSECDAEKEIAWRRDAEQSLAPADAGEDLAGLSARAKEWLTERIVATERDRDAHIEGTTTESFYNGQVVAYENALSFIARPTPAASRPVEQGDPVAWEWEYLGVSGTWALELGRERPTQAAWRRNIRPLYAHPAPAASRPAVGREEIAKWRNDALQKAAEIVRRWDPLAEGAVRGILALMADPRDDTRAGADQAQEGWVLIPEHPLPEMMGAFWRTKNTGTTEIGGEHKDSSDVAAFRAYAAAAPKPEIAR